MALDAVTFDYWNTLIRQDTTALADRRASAWLGLLEGAGFAAQRRALDAAFESVWQRYREAWTANQQFQAVAAAEHCLEAMGLDPPADVRRALVASFAGAGETAELRLTDHVAECLRRLKEAGVRLGIICDVGFTPSPALRGVLERLGLLALFDHWSFSDEVGVYKPAPAIFEHALAGLGGIDPSRAAHVGDLRRTDVAGAKGMGMLAVRYTGVFDDPGDEAEADIDCADHAELPELLSEATAVRGGGV